MSRSKDSGAIGAVYKYLKSTNRPYSVQDIFNNLHKEYGKTAVTKAVETLAAEEKIKEKVYGKQKIYFLNQNSLPTVEEEKLKDLDLNLTNLGSQLQTLEAEVKTKFAELNTLCSSMTLNEVNVNIKNAQAKSVQLQKKLAILKEKAQTVKPEENNETRAMLSKYVNEWKKRKRAVDSCVDTMMDGYPKSKKTLMEEISLETDEDAEVSLKLFNT